VATYVILYNHTSEGAKTIRESVKRAGRIRQQNARVGFTVKDVYWTQGSYDMVAIVDAPSEEAMMGAMMNVVSAGNVTSVTMRAFDAVEMSRVLAKTMPLPDDDEPKAKPAAKKAVAKPKRK
jgi:uncharacterized protein with GYD domain